MSEGSVVSDSEFVEESEETQDSTEEQVVESEPEQEAKAETQEEPQEQEPQPQLTEDGTKLDPNPLSAAHQQLANAQRKLKAYEAVLNDPNLYQQFAQKLAPQQKVEEPQLDPETATADEIVSALNLTKSELLAIKQQNEELRSQLGLVTTKQHAESVQKSLIEGMKLAQEKYPELRSGEQEYDPKLEESIVKLYQSYNYDENGIDTGRVPLTEVVELAMSIRGSGKKAASQEAQTIVKQKSMGKVVTSGGKVNSEPSEEDLTIAQRIAKASRRR